MEGFISQTHDLMRRRRRRHRRPGSTVPSASAFVLLALAILSAASHVTEGSSSHGNSPLPESGLVPFLGATKSLSDSTATTSTTTPTTSTELSTTSIADSQQRIRMLQQLLCDRHSYVISGRRMNDFSQWINQQGGEAKIFSLHGVDVNFEMDEVQNLELEVDVYPLAKRQAQTSNNNKDPFLPDRMNLNLHHEHQQQQVEKFYHGTVHEQDLKPPSALQIATRAVKLSIIFGPVLTTSWLAVISKPFRRNVWYKWISNCLATSGAAFIKYGQWSSTRPDMFPTALCDALSELHNSAPSHSWNYTQEQVESSLDIPEGCLLDVFDSFDAKPLASGSIAQVHKARLKNGQTVAAKVRHPRVAELIDMDFRLMTMLATVCDWIPGLRWLHVRDSVSQFSHTMAAQAHLNVEAHHLEVLNHNFRNWRHVRFPQPFFASPALILETYEQGNIVTDILDIYDQEAQVLGGGFKGSDLIPVELAKFIVTTGLSLYLKMLFVDNLMHADLHPGNIMLDIQYPNGDNGRNDPKLGVTLVDAGMVAQLTEEESSTFIGLMTSLGEGDGRAAAEFAMRFSLENHLNKQQRQAFIADAEKLFAEKCGGYGTNVDVGDVLQSILGLIRDHQIRIDANYATLVINAMCVESLARRVCPSYNVLEAARPLLQAYRKMCFEKDGFTRVGNSKRNGKRLKRVMPFLLERQKSTYDSSFFKRVEVQRSSRKRVARGGNERLTQQK